MTDRSRRITNALHGSLISKIIFATTMFFSFGSGLVQGKNLRLDFTDAQLLIRTVYINNAAAPPGANEIPLQDGINIVLIGLPGLSEAALIVRSWRQQISIIEEIRWTLECNAGLLTPIEARPYVPARLVGADSQTTSPTIKLYRAYRTRSRPPADYLLAPGCVFVRQGDGIRTVPTSVLRELPPPSARHLSWATVGPQPRISVALAFGSPPALYQFQYAAHPSSTLGLLPAISPADPNCQLSSLGVRSIPTRAQIITLDENRNPTLHPARTDSGLVFRCNRRKGFMIGVRVHLIEEKKATRRVPGGPPTEIVEVRDRQMETKVKLSEGERKIVRFWFDRGDVTISPR